MSAKLKLYHPTCRGTGCAIGLELHPATAEQEGSIILEMAHQRTVNGKDSEFDWSDTVCVRLGFNELTKILQVFRGECESVDDGKGLFLREPSVKRLVLDHRIEPVCGYSLEVFEEPVGGAERRFAILLTNAEALGICEAIVGAMVWVAFGDPHAHCRCAERRAE